MLPGCGERCVRPGVGWGLVATTSVPVLKLLLLLLLLLGPVLRTSPRYPQLQRARGRAGQLRASDSVSSGFGGSGCRRC